MKIARLSIVSVCVAGIGVFASTVRAADISFGPGQNFSGPTDIDTNGSDAGAYDFNGAGPLTINGVSFTNFGAPNTQSGLNTGFGGYGSGGQTGDYATLLSNGIYADGPSTSLTLAGLTAGHTYEMQVFVNDSRQCCGGRILTVSGDTTTGFGSLAFDGDTGPVGQYAIGTFVADKTGQQVLTLDADGTANTTNNQINGLVLRDITNAPEPASLCLLGLGAMGLLARRRRA